MLDGAANDMSTAIGDRIMRNGGNKPTSDLPKGVFKHTGLGDGVDDGDSSNMLLVFRLYLFRSF
ncbi:MAG: hypothetical protein HRU29_12080 [Rhizobiales bacterium]|nr:hypothetical protein [Hyphomicrobiales bacterium]NRB15126.1 hypothetical protein [Hyphomicrobiales bacterium]